MKQLFMLILLVSFLFAFDAHAVFFKCKGSYLDSSYSKLDVMKYCGEPVMVDGYTKTETIIVNKEEVDVSCKHIDQWYYSYGANRTTFVVEFISGFVSGVRQGRNKP